MASRSSYSSGTDNTKYPCPNCGGTGTLTHRNGPITCPTCHGLGQVNYKAQQKFLNAQPLSPIPSAVQFVTCPECGGSKEIMDPDTGKIKDCPTCQATGQVTIDEKDNWLKKNEEE